MGLEKRFAIVVGTNAYAEKKLKFSIKDSKDIKEILLQRCEFKEENIIHLEFESNDLTTRVKEIIESFNQIKEKGFQKNMHTLFFYFSGHGNYDEKLEKSYLELSDNEKISIQEIWKNIDVLSGKNNYLVIDACHSGGNIDFNINEQKAGKIQRQLFYNSNTIYCIFGAGKNSLAYEPTDLQSKKFKIQNGYLTHFILEIFNDKTKYTEGFLSAKAIDDYVSLKTQLQSSFKQVPVSHTDVKGYHPLGIWNEDTSTTTNQSLPLNSKQTNNETEIINSGEIPVNKDVVIFKSFNEEFDYQIMILDRFSNECIQNYYFSSDKLTFDNSSEIQVVNRAATITGLQRITELNPSNFKDKKIQIFLKEENNDEEISSEVSKCINEKREQLKELLYKNLDINYCLHCSKVANFNDVHFVELDSKDFAPNIGFVHPYCLRETDRVIGQRMINQPEISKRLENFDLNKWFELLQKGQGFLQAAKKLKAYSIFSWYPDPKIDLNHSFCLRYKLADGSYEYDKKYGHKIDRMSQERAELWLSKLKPMQMEAKAKGDPDCFTSKKRTGGTYSQLLTLKDDDEDIIEIIDIEIVKYSKQFESDLFSSMDNSIAPLCYLIDKKDKVFIGFLRFAPLISNPMAIDNFVKNWEKELGYQIDDFELVMIKSDKDFDDTITFFLKEGVIPVVDPLFDKEFNLVRGIVIQPQEELIRNSIKENKMEFNSIDKPRWKSGEIVSVVLPNMGRKKPAIGKLLEDEMENKEGEKVIIFKPVDESGKEIENVGPFVIPSKFILKE